MNLTKEYIKAAEGDVTSLSRIHKGYWEEPRYQILKKFCGGTTNILSVGCGYKEPIIINASHAIDITPLSEQYLKKQGWKGYFQIGSCTSIPYPDKSFNTVVCSEVIEHLPSIVDVTETFHEVARVGKRWIITTPNSAVIKPKDQNPTHRQFFTVDSIKRIIPFNCTTYTNDHHIYMESL